MSCSESWWLRLKKKKKQPCEHWGWHRTTRTQGSYQTIRSWLTTRQHQARLFTSELWLTRKPGESPLRWLDQDWLAIDVITSHASQWSEWIGQREAVLIRLDPDHRFCSFFFPKCSQSVVLSVNLAFDKARPLTQTRQFCKDIAISSLRTSRYRSAVQSHVKVLIEITNGRSEFKVRASSRMIQSPLWPELSVYRPPLCWPAWVPLIRPLCEANSLVLTWRKPGGRAPDGALSADLD